jgi:hypothetical protein
VAYTVGVGDRDGVGTSAPGSMEVVDNRLRGGKDDSGGESGGRGESAGERTIDMYKGWCGLDSEDVVEGEGVECSSEVSSSLLSFSIAGEPSSTAASLLRPRLVRPVKDVQAARIVFHASTRSRTMNVWWIIESRRATTGEVSGDTEAADVADGVCGRCNDASAMKSAGDESERLGRALVADPLGFDGRRKDFVDQVCTRGSEDDSEPVALRERVNLSVMNESCSVVGVDGGVLADASASN